MCKKSLHTSTYQPAISFAQKAAIARIEGSLGSIFPTLANNTNPIFQNLFKNATNLSGEIPENLFAGISGAPAASMFADTFSWNWNLTAVPADLFSGISGAPAPSMYAATFKDTGLRSITKHSQM